MYEIRGQTKPLGGPPRICLRQRAIPARTLPAWAPESRNEKKICVELYVSNRKQLGKMLSKIELIFSAHAFYYEFLFISFIIYNYFNYLILKILHKLLIKINRVAITSPV
jgi:hypothetical protein